MNLAEPDPSPLPENQPQANQVETVTEARLNEPEVSQEEPKTIEKFDITVTSQIVKRVDGKCRYFFDVRNQDTKDFGGSVLISVYSDSIKSPLSSITFTARNPISPSLGHSVSLDASTCPPSIHGADGMTRYTYEVNIENSIVTKGEGRLTEKFEDLDAYNF